MWRVVVFYACFQIIQRNIVNGQGIDKDLFSKIKGEINRGSETSKKAEFEHWGEEELSNISLTTVSDPGISLPDEFANGTIKTDYHRYYNSSFYTNSEAVKSYWVNIDKLPEEHVITNKMLSNSHRQATTIELSFDFPFYGSLMRNITLATGGFLYMGDYMHNWIAATQYVAPLMANFDTTISENSTVKYADNGTAFTVQWDNVFIKDRVEDGAFTFQVTLFQNGDICFAYKTIPFSISEISVKDHPVKVGISDAYILERNVFFIRRMTIYEYHRVDMMNNNISNNTAIYFTALPTCLNYKNCESCMAADVNLECTWCNSVERCSDGIDRQRQSWIVKGCAIKSHNICVVHGPELLSDITTKSAQQSVIETSSKEAEVSLKTSESNESNPKNIVFDLTTESGSSKKEVVAHYIQEELQVRSTSSISTGAIVAVVIFIAVLIGISAWIFYAYKFPQTSSGQFLIKYRPSQWSFKPEGHSVNVDSYHM